MAHIHNAILRGFSSIYVQAKHVTDEDKVEFIGYSQVWFRFVVSHHDDEELGLFPEIEEIIGARGSIDKTRADHASFLAGLVSFNGYLSILDEPFDFNGRELCRIMDFFKVPFKDHFHNEIATITAFGDLPTAPKEGSPEAQQAAAIFKVWGKQTVNKACLADGVPFFLLNLDVTYEDASKIHELHGRYGPLVRVSPNEVDISDADAIQPIYVSKGGFAKAPCYANFDIDGHKTIFSTTEPDYRSRRAKAVLPLFSTKSMRDNEAAISGCVDRMVARLGEESATGRPVNLINLSRCLAVDVVSTHLFYENYHGVEEKGSTLSASAFVDAFVAVGRFFYLPNTIFAWAEWIMDHLTSDTNTHNSMAIVDRFVETLAKGTTKEQTNYPGRLMAAGLGVSEIKAQCKDLIFAGTDSTGMNLAMIVRSLVLHPDKYEKLRQEIKANASLGSDAQEAQALPYLSAVIKEGLRISMANPTRLPHVVPPEGWTFKSTYFPPGSIVGCSAFELHMNPLVFPSPREMIPERWLDANNLELMNKHWFAFGAGSRACIARNLATLELYIATERLARSGVLTEARCVDEREVAIYEWFNSKVKGEKIDITWDIQSR